MRPAIQITSLPMETMRWGGVVWEDFRPIAVPRGSGAEKALRRNMPLIRKRYIERCAFTEPAVGDIILIGGHRMRIAYLWGDSFQPCYGGSFYMYQGGGMSMSGSLENCHPMELTLVGTDMASAWIFENDWAGADRGLHFNVRVKVWRYDGEIEPYLARQFAKAKYEADWAGLT